MASPVTLADVLALPVVRRGLPSVHAAGDADLRRPVRWAHVSELSDVGSVLSGGELVLTTGINLPDSDAALVGYVAGLARANAAGLVLELGRRFTSEPPALVDAAVRYRVPFVALRREVKFVEITEAVHGLILGERLQASRTAERAHETFTALAVEGADAQRIVDAAARMCRAPVVFENLLHHVVAYSVVGSLAPEADAEEEVLRDWPSRSRGVTLRGRTAIAGPESWLVTTVETTGEVWGRLVMVPGVPGAVPASTQAMVLERAAVALTLNRLLESSRTSVDQQAHRSTLADIVEHRWTTPAAMHARTAALGVPTDGRSLVVLVGSDPSPDAETVMGEAVRATSVPALVAALTPGRVGVLLALADDADPATAGARVASSIRRARPSSVVAMADPVTSLDQVRTAVTAAGEVIDSLGPAYRRRDGDPDVFRPSDVRVRGLLTLLADDPRVQAFVERSLGPLLVHDTTHGTALVAALRAHLDHGGVVSRAARAAYVSRQTFYQRLGAAARVLGADLNDPETRTSLHAALMTHDATP